MIQSIHSALWNTDISSESTFSISGLRDAINIPTPVYIGDIILEPIDKSSVRCRRIEAFLLPNKTLKLKFHTNSHEIATTVLDNCVEALITKSELSSDELRDVFIKDILNEFEHKIVQMILDEEITETEFLTGIEDCSFDFETRKDENIEILERIHALSEQVAFRVKKGPFTSDDDDIVFEMLAQIMYLRSNILPNVTDQQYRQMLKDWLSCSI
jgi:hypothetical protein